MQPVSFPKLQVDNNNHINEKIKRNIVVTVVRVIRAATLIKYLQHLW